MSTYIALLKWTAQGLNDIKDSPSRLDAGRKAFGAIGVTLKEFYMVTGRYDCIAILEAPDDITLAKTLLTLASQGSIVSETCRAFPEAEYRRIINDLS